MAADQNNMCSIFSSFQDYLNSEQDKREEIKNSVRALEQTAREILAIAQRSHHSNENGITEICREVRESFKSCRQKIKDLDEKVPVGQYFRFNDHWRLTMQRLAFLACFVTYLEHERLALRQEVADLIGVKLDWKDGFFLDLDDYLIGLLLLANELSRLAVNSVTIGNYKRPYAIAAFLSGLDTAFRLLNLKNDSLRKKFDGLKYDLKKVEEVVYDLCIRGLKDCQDEQNL